jgi:hypothetical protein
MPGPPLGLVSAEPARLKRSYPFYACPCHIPSWQYITPLNVWNLRSSEC